MHNLDMIIKKLDNNEYSNFSMFYRDFNFNENSESLLFYFIKNMSIGYGEKAFIKFFKDEDFVTSLTTCLRVAKYLENKNNMEFNYSFLKDVDTRYPSLSGIFYLTKGTMSIRTDTKIRKVNFIYAVKGGGGGMPSINGSCKITRYDENTKDILDSLFSIGD